MINKISPVVNILHIIINRFAESKSRNLTYEAESIII